VLFPVFCWLLSRQVLAADSAIADSFLFIPKRHSSLDKHIGEHFGGTTLPHPLRFDADFQYDTAQAMTFLECRRVLALTFVSIRGPLLRAASRPVLARPKSEVDTIE
jgi:hypothetical protein